MEHLYGIILKLIHQLVSSGHSNSFSILSSGGHLVQWSETGAEAIKLFSCSTQMSMKFSPLIHVKMPTIVGILTCMSGKNSILCLYEPKKC